MSVSIYSHTQSASICLHLAVISAELISSPIRYETVRLSFMLGDHLYFHLCIVKSWFVSSSLGLTHLSVRVHVLALSFFSSLD